MKKADLDTLGKINAHQYSREEPPHGPKPNFSFEGDELDNDSVATLLGEGLIHRSLRLGSGTYRSAEGFAFIRQTSLVDLRITREGQFVHRVFEAIYAAK